MGAEGGEAVIWDFARVFVFVTIGWALFSVPAVVLVGGQVFPVCAALAGIALGGVVGVWRAYERP